MEYHACQYKTVKPKMSTVAMGFRRRLASLAMRRLSPTCRDTAFHPGASNRICGSPASGFPAGFTIKHAAGGISRWMPCECIECHRTFSLGFGFPGNARSDLAHSRPEVQDTVHPTGENNDCIRSLQSNDAAGSPHNDYSCANSTSIGSFGLPALTTHFFSKGL